MPGSIVECAYIVGSFCSILSTMDISKTEFRQRMDTLNYMLTELKIC